MKPNQFRSLIAASGQAPVAVSSVHGSSSTSSETNPASRRRPGKRTAPDYAQVGVYIPKRLHHQAKVLLLQEGESRDFSQLIGDLLSAYVSHQSTGTSNH